MNFCDKMTLRFRKQGLSDNEISNKLRKYYFYSKVALVIYLFALILLVLRDRFEAENIFVLILFIIWFAVCLMMFLQLRKYTKVNKKI
jgi:hypothetical protein